MKKGLILFSVSLAAANAATACAQGTVAFYNAGNQVNAPFFDANGVFLSGTNYVAQLYAGASPGVLFGFGKPVPFPLWQDVNPVTFVDTTAMNFATRFYRLALP